MRILGLKRFLTGFGPFLIAIAISASAHAASLRQGSTGNSGAATGSLPGEVLWGLLQDR